jgi:hypothetical protein
MTDYELLIKRVMLLEQLTVKVIEYTQFSAPASIPLLDSLLLSYDQSVNNAIAKYNDTNKG